MDHSFPHSDDMCPHIEALTVDRQLHAVRLPARALQLMLSPIAQHCAPPRNAHRRPEMVSLWGGTSRKPTKLRCGFRDAVTYLTWPAWRSFAARSMEGELMFMPTVNHNPTTLGQHSSDSGRGLGGRRYGA